MALYWKDLFTQRIDIRIKLHCVYGDRLFGIGGGWNWNKYRVQWRTSEPVVMKLAGSVTTLLVHEQYTCAHDCNFIYR
jgi:hypothetical protein